LTSLKKAYRKAAEEKKPGLQSLRQIQRKQLTNLRQPETVTNCRESIQLAVGEERREELVANHWPVVSDQHYRSAALRVSWA